MAYIRHKVIKGHVYYYLVEGHREGKRVRQKVLKYLGKHGTLSASSGVIYRGFSKPVEDNSQKQSTEARQRIAIKKTFSAFGYSVRHNLSGRNGVKGRVRVVRNKATREIIERSVSFTKNPDISTMCHELGHVIDLHLREKSQSFWETAEFNGNGEKFQSEFERVGAEVYGVELSKRPALINNPFFRDYVFTKEEGFANAFDLFLTDYKKALRVVPNLVAEFHKIIRENDDIRQQLERLDLWTVEEAKQHEGVVPNENG